MAKKYRKKPVVIEAVMVGSESYKSTAEWCGGEIIREGDGTPSIAGIAIKTLEGTMLANTGDYIIRGVQGEFYPCKPDIFDATYERV